MSVKILTKTGEDLTCGDGYFVPVSSLREFEEKMRKDGFVVVEMGAM